MLPACPQPPEAQGRPGRAAARRWRAGRRLLAEAGVEARLLSARRLGRGPGASAAACSWPACAEGEARRAGRPGAGPGRSGQCRGCPAALRFPCPGHRAAGRSAADGLHRRQVPGLARRCASVWRTVSGRNGAARLDAILAWPRARLRSQGLSPRRGFPEGARPGRARRAGCEQRHRHRRRARGLRRAEPAPMPASARLADLQEKAADRDAHGILELALTGEFARPDGGGVVLRRGIGGAAAHGGGDRSHHADPVPQHRQAVRRDAALSRPPAGRAGPGRCAQPGARAARRAARSIPMARCGRATPMPAAISARWCRWPARLKPFAAQITGPQAFPDPRARRNAAGGIVRRPLSFQSALAMERKRNLRPMPWRTSCRAIRWWRTDIPRSAACPAPAAWQAGEDYRAGRWAGLDKDECGIHPAPMATGFRAAFRRLACLMRAGLLNPAAYQVFPQTVRSWRNGRRASLRC